METLWSAYSRLASVSLRDGQRLMGTFQLIYVVGQIIQLVFQLTGPTLSAGQTVLTQICGTALMLAAFFECWSSVMAVVVYKAGLS